ncbi:FlgN family protein [Melioribacter roseus P3M-2]|uniref:FlgN family protein n=1 Tax=Melioribacter roseus (strain DSM 23840 / JCM 17771 / VKM B-2668 / P3M-2) TaxID=1191523 RepID=I7A685_MELRP|nr:flagellar export chaperone FlgN [Melioribacter roseus]AFN75391.1 FlgN family protein [Melioribacter roseus P3M-2]
MNLENLIESLKRQEKNFSDLLETIRTKKEALLKNDLAKLDKAVDGEQKLLHLIQKEERERKRLTYVFATENSIELTNASIEELLKKMPQLSGQLKSARDSIKSKAAEIIKINSQLTVLVGVSRNLIRDTVTTLLGKGKKSIVNKRV